MKIESILLKRRVKMVDRKNIIRYNFRMFFSLLAQVVIFFYAAGELEIPRAWFFFVLTFIYYLSSFIILYKLVPETINQRGGSAFRKDTKPWDILILLLYAIFGIFGQFYVAGWDMGHINFWPLGLEYLGIGLVLYFISIILIMWAMIQNPFFEPTMRIQKERRQKVIKSGPYQIVRHPGYLSVILWHLAIPMILGSSLALIYSSIIILLLIIRTYLEDKTLQKELEGYREYNQETKFRLLPFVW